VKASGDIPAKPLAGPRGDADRSALPVAGDSAPAEAAVTAHRWHRPTSTLDDL